MILIALFLAIPIVMGLSVLLLKALERMSARWVSPGLHRLRGGHHGGRRDLLGESRSL